MVTFYTRERGLVEAVARGIGKPGSTLSAAVEPFTLAKLFFAQGRNVDHLTQCRVIEPFYALRQDMARYAHASCACELVLRTTEPTQAVVGLFDLLERYLRALAEGDADPQVLSWSFQLAYLRLSGLAPVLGRCVECGKGIAAGLYSAGKGGLLCADCAPHDEQGLRLSAGSVKFLENLARFDPDQLRRLRLTERARGDLSALLRSHIRYHLDLSLKSEAFLRRLHASDPEKQEPGLPPAPGDGGQNCGPLGGPADEEG